MLVVVSGYAASHLHTGESTTPQVTGSLTQNPQRAQPRGASGLPLPRYVSLKSSRVNVRIGPSQDHAVAWVFNAAGLPVEIIAESENWRRIRDSEGAQGWVYHSLLSGRRTALVAPWPDDDATGGQANLENLHRYPREEAKPVARLERGALVSVEDCQDTWCRIEVAGLSGYLRQELLWGVYPGEQID